MFYIYSNGNNSKALDEPVHERFVKMVKCAFAKMAGAGLMDPELINRDFWRWFPTKMNNSKNYLKRAKKVKKKKQFHILCPILSRNFMFPEIGREVCVQKEEPLQMQQPGKAQEKEHS